MTGTSNTERDVERSHRAPQDHYEPRLQEANLNFNHASVQHYIASVRRFSLAGWEYRDLFSSSDTQTISDIVNK